MSVIALALSDGVPLFELAAPCAVFDAHPGLVDDEWYTFRVCGPQNARVGQWFRSATEYTYDDLATADTIVVPACHDGDLCPPADLVAALRAAYDGGARVMSICTGAFVLAEAGILDGKRATTHWAHAGTLAKRYPAVTVDPDVLYTDEGRVLTSAGKAAGMDLCLHLVRRDHGAAVANEIARRLVTPPHREGGQAQYVTPGVPKSSYDDLSRVMQWALEHLGEPITVEDLASRAHLGTRTLNRHFHARVGTNPQQWLHSQRIRRAQELLEQTDDSIDLVARAAGLSTPAVLRRHFRRVLNTTPDAYRRLFNDLGAGTANP